MISALARSGVSCALALNFHANRATFKRCRDVQFVPVGLLFAVYFASHRFPTRAVIGTVCRQPSVDPFFFAVIRNRFRSRRSCQVSGFASRPLSLSPESALSTVRPSQGKRHCWHPVLLSPDILQTLKGFCSLREVRETAQNQRASLVELGHPNALTALRSARLSFDARGRAGAFVLAARAHTRGGGGTGEKVLVPSRK